MTRRSLYACLALILTVSLVSVSAPSPVLAQDLELNPGFASDPIPDIWADVDSESAREASERSWMWGPSIRSATHEPYVESPDGVRAVYYFDKARMEINNPGESWDSIWYATSGLLIREMMLGQIQVGDHESIHTTPAEIPVTGDLENNPDSPTYATLGELTALGGQEENRVADQVGEPVEAKLHADGSIETLSSPPADAEVAYYDETLGFNVPDIFWDWMNDQPIDWKYVIGHPVTEAYWVDTVIDGEATTVMMQAFERRVLTFNPANEPQWQVEAGNAGLHYRSWRGLNMSEDSSLHALAHEIPYGEIITDAAEKNGVDPYLLAGVARAASGFDPKAELSSDRIGLTGVPLPMLQRYGIENPLDPTLNAQVAADLLALLYNENGGSWETAIAEYFAWQDGSGTFAAASSGATDEAISAWNDMNSTYSGQPSPFTSFDEPAPEPEPEPQPEPEPEPQAPSEPDIDANGLQFIGSGEAAHYGQGYTVDRMEEIMDVHTAWDGGAVDGWEYDPNGYYCVHPDFIVGERLQLTAPNGETFWCTIADYVRIEHRTQWRSKWAIEVNWDLFEAMGVPYQQTIEVRAPVE